MKTKYIVPFLFLFITLNSFAQQDLNAYKYVIVPNKYDFLKKADKYQLNALTQFLFKKYGFTAIMDNEGFPKDLANNRCLALQSNVLNNSGLFKTKLQVELRDCNNTVVYTSSEGVSREKEYKKAYTLALREAFKSFEGINYNYKPSNAILAATNTNSNSDTANEIEKLKKEIKVLKEAKEVELVKAEPVVASVKTTAKETASSISKNASNLVLYAQAIPGGFQLVDSTPRVVMILLETAKTNTFIVKDNNAIVYKEDGLWYLSKNSGQKITTKTVDIKF